MAQAKLNEWLTLLANLGVIGGLVLLAYEVHQANQLSEASAIQARMSEIQESQKDIALSADLADIRVRAIENGVASLTPTETFRLRRWEEARNARMVGQIEQYRLGFLDHETALGVTQAMMTFEAELWGELGMQVIARPSTTRVLESLRQEVMSGRE